VNAYTIFLSPDAITDLADGFDYYNKQSYGFGFEFSDTINAYLSKIRQVPTASSIRYDEIRVKPVAAFPYTIHYIIDEINQCIIIVRIFNTYQQPFW